MADALGLGPSGETRESSTLSSDTKAVLLKGGINGKTKSSGFAL